MFSFFGESHNSTLKKGQMDLYISFWGNCSYIVEICHLTTSCLMGKATAQDVYDSFKECSTSLDDKKVIKVSSDGSNVNLKLGFWICWGKIGRKRISQSCYKLLF